MLEQCQICQNIIYPIFVITRSKTHYGDLQDISGFFDSAENAHNRRYCSRICCSGRLEKIEDELHDYDDTELLQLIAQAMDDRTYFKEIYVKAIIAASLTEDIDFLLNYAKYPTWSVIQTEHKYKKLVRLHNDGRLTRDQHLSYKNILRDYDHRGDDFKLQSAYGSFIQRLAIYYLPSDVHRMEVVREGKPGGIILYTIALMKDKIVLRHLVEDYRGDKKLVALSRLPISAKRKIYQQLQKLTEVTAVLENMEEHQELLEQWVITQKDLVPKMQIIRQLKDTQILHQLLEHDFPQIRITALYRLKQLNQLDGLDVEKLLLNAIKHYSLFFPYTLPEDRIYRILLENPQHELARYLISNITDPNLLKKLSFHNNLRPLIRDQFDRLG